MENTEVKISAILKQLGILPNLLGYHYLREAISMMLKDNSLISRGVTKILYPEVGNKFNATGPQVERAIRHAVERVFLYGDLNLIESIFGSGCSSTRGKATNSEFIACVSEYIKLTA